MSKEMLTVLVPAYNEEANIVGAMNALSTQQIPEGFVYKVIILSNGCTDETTPMARRFIDRYKGNNVQWQVKELVEPSKSGALNAGLSEVCTDIVVYTDGDCRVANGALGRLYHALYNDDDLLVAGGLDVPDFSGMDKNSLLYQFQAVQQIRREERGRTMPVGRLMGFKRQCVGGFPTTIPSEDSWLTLSVAQKYGWHVVHVLMDAEVSFVPPHNWVDYIRQQSRYEAVFDNLLSNFPELEEVYYARMSYYQQRPAKDIDDSILIRMADLGIDPLRFYQSREIIDEIIRENRCMMRELLVRDNGTWESVATTKRFNVNV